jgi:hypothetical protein
LPRHEGFEALLCDFAQTSQTDLPRPHHAGPIVSSKIS